MALVHIFMRFFAAASMQFFQFIFFQTKFTMINKYLFTALAIFIAGSLAAQSRLPNTLAKVPKLQPVPFQKNGPALEVFTPEIETPHDIISSSDDRNMEEIAGITRWDAQGYGCVPSRVYYKPNGDPVATWTFAIDGTNAFPERGTGYSSRSAGAWSPSDDRIESVRTGFPSASILSDGTEVVVSHTTAFTPYGIMFLRRPAGASSWTESYLDLPAGVGCLWPHLAVGGADGMTIHVIGITTPTANTGVVYEGVNGHILYWRSTDGGLTWDKKFVKIPGLDSSKFVSHGADEYAIDANGDVVGVTAFPAWNDLLVFKSYDNGDTWETITVRDFPDALENYAGADGESYTFDDIGVYDPDAPDSLAIFNSDSWGNILIDNASEAHVFFGRMYYADLDVAAGTVFYPSVNGLAHWKESLGTDTYQTIAGALDYDGDGFLNITTISEIAPYFGSLSTQPSSGIGPDGTIYVGYSALHELYRHTTEQFFRHVYLVKSADNGDNWGEPLNIIAHPYISDTVLIPYIENVYPMLPRHIGSNVGLVYQQDFEPGIQLLGATHPFGDNNLLWVEIDPDDIPGVSGTFTPPKPTLGLSLSPNPTAINPVLTATLTGTGDVVVEIFDLVGNRVFQQSVPSVAGRQSVSLPVHNLLSGSYWVRVTEGKQFGITKLVVAK